MKPLTTLGDALMAKGASDALDWRAQMRAEDIPRRPPPASETRSSRPDRGYVEQPEERINTTTFPSRRREETPTLTTPVALIRFSRDETRPRRPYMDPTTGKLVDPNAEPAKSALDKLIEEHRDEQLPPPIPVAASCVEATPANQTQTEEAVEVPRAKKKRGPDSKPRQSWAKDVKEAAARRVLTATEPGMQAKVARELGATQTTVSNWVKVYTKNHRPPYSARPEQTLFSRPTPPTGKDTAAAIASMVRSTTRTFETVSRELQEALDRVRELKRELRGLLDE